MYLRLSGLVTLRHLYHVRLACLQNWCRHEPQGLCFKGNLAITNRFKAENCSESGRPLVVMVMVPRSHLKIDLHVHANVCCARFLYEVLTTSADRPHAADGYGETVQLFPHAVYDARLAIVSSWSVLQVSICAWRFERQNTTCQTHKACLAGYSEGSVGQRSRYIDASISVQHSSMDLCSPSRE